MNFLSFLFGISCCKLSNDIFRISRLRVSICLSYSWGLLIYFGNLSRNLTLETFVHSSGTLTVSLMIFFSTLNSKKFSQLLNHVLVQEEKYFLSSLKMIHSISVRFLFFCVLCFLLFLNLDLIFISIWGNVVIFSFSIYLFYTYNLLTLSQISTILFWTKRSLWKINQDLKGLKFFNVGEIAVSGLNYSPFSKLNNQNKLLKLKTKLEVSEKTF